MTHMKEFFRSLVTKPVHKVIAQSCITAGITVIGAWPGTFDPTQTGFRIQMPVFVLLVLSEMVFLIASTTVEVNTRRAKEELEKQMRGLKMLGSNVIKICEENANNLNECLKDEHENKINLKLWNFDKASILLCQCIYELLKDMFRNDNFEIAYVRRSLDENKQDIIFMNAYANKGNSKPSIWRIIRLIKDDKYYDAQLFRTQKSDVNVLMNAAMIDEKFSYPNGKGTEYNQYVSVPVMCSTKMVGLLEVVSFRGTQLGLTEQEVLEFANKYLVPYARMFLLLHKTERALLLGTQIEGR